MDQQTIKQAEWTNPNNWRGPRWVSVYFSKRDSRVWVPKRISAFGWTINLGRPGGVAWLFALALGLSLLALGVCILTRSLG